MVSVRYWSRKGLFLVAFFFSVHAAYAQAVELRIGDMDGRPLKEATVHLLAHTSTNSIVVDSVRLASGLSRVRVPAPRTTTKLYIIKVCAEGHSPQFVDAPFIKSDTLRLTVQLAIQKPGSTPAHGACAGAPDEVIRAAVTDTSTFVGLAAASNLEVTALRGVHAAFLRAGTRQDTVEARLYQLRTLARLERRLLRATSPFQRARAAHMTLSFAFWTRAALDRRTRTSLRAALPPSSKWWLTQPYLVGLWGTQLLFVPGIAGDPSPLTKSATTRREMVAYLTRMTGFIDEPQIRSEVQSQLVRLAYIGADTIRAQELLNQMLVETPNYPFTRLIASRYAPNRPLREGAALPAFNFASLPDTTSRITNATITGKFTLIDFWGTWCGPCLAAMPELHRIYQLYRHRGFEILSVAADESPEVVNKFRAGKWPMPWLNAFARYSEGVEENRQLQELGILIFPRAVLVDPQGKIAAVLGAEMEELALTLDRLLAGSDIR